MNFMKYILAATKTCMSKYFNPRGRASRPEFWYFLLFTFLISLLISSSRSVIVSPRNLGDAVVNLFFFIPLVMVSIRRLHDLNKPGSFAFLLLVPFIGVIILLFMCSKEGTKGDNNFGPVPDDLVGRTKAPDFGEDAVDVGGYDPNAEPVERPSLDFNYEDIDYGVDAEDEAATTPKRDRYGRLIDGADGKAAKKKSDFLEG